MDENIAAATIDLTTDDMREIEDTAAKIQFQGGRYPEQLERMTNL